MGGGPRGSMGPRFGGFGFRHDDRFFNHHRFVDHDRFFDHRFVDHNRFFDHRFVDHDRFFDHRFVDHNRFFDHRFVDHDRFFFHHQNRFFFGFDFVSFGFPWWYPWYPPYPPYYGYYPPYYGYSYDSPYSGGGQDFDYQYWTNLAASVQSELTRRGYYHGPTDGVIGSDSSEAIRAFQAAQGLPVTGRIDSKLLSALGIRYRSA
jgi:Putative peptidoglycan binding domain